MPTPRREIAMAGEPAMVSMREKMKLEWDVKPGHCKSQTHYYSVQIDNSKYEGISLVSLVKVDCSLKIVRNSAKSNYCQVL